MGTNFYRRRIPREEDYDRMSYLVSIKELDTLLNLLQGFKEKIHICKRSAGWEILFDHNWGKYYKISRKDLENFLSEPGTEIIDEYGKSYTCEEFWNMVDSWNSKPGLISDRDTVTSGDYYACTFEKLRCKEELGIDPQYNDFRVDNIRFAVFSDFS
jgi:hypothetical protein